jgi:transcriptional regulator with XRE-family HTH domain
LEKIGLFLKTQREELGFTIQEMSQKTKISTLQLKELENGNIDFFHDDITYLPFMIRRYAKALYVDDKIRDDLDGLVSEYQQTMQIKKIKEHDDIEQGVVNRVKQAAKSNQKISPAKHSKRPEFSQLSLIFIILVIIASLLFMVVTVVLPLINQANKDPVVDNPITELPDNPNDKPEVEDPVIVDPEKPGDTTSIKIQQKDPITYELIDYTEDEEVTLSIAFNAKTWVQVYLDGKKTDIPQSRIYDPGENIDVITFAKVGHEVTFHVGIMKSNEFFLNEEVIVLDPSVSDVNYGIKISFVFKGE